MSYDGILVLGMPRSGTTLLRRILNAHPSIACPPETNLFQAAARFLREDDFGDGMTVGVVSGLSFSGFNDDDVVDRVRDLVFGLMSEICRREDKQVWAEKTAFDAFYVDEIERMCGDRCRYVCIFRHPLDVIVSLKELCDKMETYLPELHQYVCRYSSPFDALAHAWTDVCDRMLQLQFRRPEHVMFLKYESVVMDVRRETERVLQFLGLPADSEAIVEHAMNEPVAVGLGDWKTYHRTTINDNSIGRWRGLSETTIQRLTKIVEEIAKKLGYEVVAPVPVDVSPKEIRRRYELGLRVAQLRGETMLRPKSTEGEGQS